MKALLKVIMAICAVIGVYFMAMAAIEARSRKSDDKIHIAQLKGLLPFGRLAHRREAYDGEEVVARKIADYRDDEDSLASLDDEEETSAVTARLPRMVKHADPEGQKRISRLREVVAAADSSSDDDDDSDAVSFSEDALEDLLEG